MIFAFGPVLIRLLGDSSARRARLARATLPLQIGAVGSIVTNITLGLLPFGHSHGNLVLMPFGDLPSTVPHNLFLRWLVVQLGGNIAVYMPIGFCVPVALPRMDRWKRIVPTGALLSLSIEIAQYYLPIGRVSATTDVMTNTAGVACGYLVLRLLRGSR